MKKPEDEDYKHIIELIAGYRENGWFVDHDIFKVVAANHPYTYEQVYEAQRHYDIMYLSALDMMD